MTTEEENKQLKEQLAEKCKEVNTLRDKLKDLKEEITECYVDGQDYVELREQKDKEIEELKEQLTIREKALELACRSLQFDFDYDNANEAENHNKELYNNFIEQAKGEYEMKQLYKYGIIKVRTAEQLKKL